MPEKKIEDVDHVVITVKIDLADYEGMRAIIKRKGYTMAEFIRQGMVLLADMEGAHEGQTG